MPPHDLGLYDAIVLFAITALLHFLSRREILRGRLVAYAAWRLRVDRPGLARAT